MPEDYGYRSGYYDDGYYRRSYRSSYYDNGYRYGSYERPYRSYGYYDAGYSGYSGYSGYYGYGGCGRVRVADGRGGWVWSRRACY